MIIRARVVLPISGAPIENGAVVIQKSRIAVVGSWTDLKDYKVGEVQDLGDAIILPGLINAHCHLDYTDLAGHIPPPKRFTDWIKAIVALKAAWSYSEFAQSWIKGARMLLQSGVTTVADIEAVPELLPDVWGVTPLRVISFRELIQLKSGIAEETLNRAAGAWQRLRGAHGRIGLSPHAPYSTTPALLGQAVMRAKQHHWPLTTHAAESEEEFEMFMYRHGALYDWLRGQRDMSDCGLGSPIQQLERCGYLAARPLLAHVNYLWRDDASLLGRRKVSVAHCPRSHAYFKHLLFPRHELSAAGVNICLGTDSLASTLKVSGEPLELNMFSEMRALVRHAPDLSPTAVVRAATINGAVALGLNGHLGELSAGAKADLVALPFQGTSGNACDAVINHRGPVKAVMIGGAWIVGP